MTLLISLLYAACASILLYASSFSCFISFLYNNAVLLSLQNFTHSDNDVPSILLSTFVLCHLQQQICASHPDISHSDHSEQLHVFHQDRLREHHCNRATKDARLGHI
ncbi:unnamed protein product [Choristocarpus tenellus]